VRKWELQAASKGDINQIFRLPGIYRALQILFPDKECSDQWLHSPNDNPMFGGSAPMEKMLGGFVVDLATVRTFLDSQLSE
jgi:hypothetical protein